MPVPREKPKQKSIRIKNSETSSSKQEILGIILVALGAFLAISLFSFSSLDSLDNVGHFINYGGYVGFSVALSFFQFLGLSSFLVLILLFFMGGLCFIEHRSPIKLRHLFLLSFFVFLSTVFFQLYSQQITLDQSEFYAGGWLGMTVAEPLKHYLNLWGAYLVVLSLGILSFVLGTGVSVVSVGIWCKRFTVAVWMKLKILSVIYSARIAKVWAKYKEKREANQKLKIEQNKQSQEVKISLSKPKPVEEQLPEKVIRLLPKADRAPNNSGQKSEEPKVFARQDSDQDPKNIQEQLSFSQMMKGYIPPLLSLLEDPPKTKVIIDEANLKANSKLLEQKLLDYGVEGKVTEIHPGPVITMYEFEPAAGVKVSRIVSLEDDLSLSMGGRAVRIVSHLQGKAAVGIEIPNYDRETVYLKEIIADARFQKAESKLTLAIGKDIEGLPLVADLQKMPHLLVAGATGTGKSVGLNAMILSMLYRASPEEVRFIFVDPKMLELSIYQGIPHLLLPVVTEPKKAAVSLRWAVAEMERRYKLMSHAQVRNIAGYNKKIEKGLLKDSVLEAPVGSDANPIKHDQKLPFIVIIIDELADLMLVAGREVEEYITRLAQMARAAGIHLILATQRPSVDVITGIIKANFPARISFKVSSTHDSRTILDSRGSEHLLGMGDMLFLPPGVAKLTRVHGAYVSDAEVTQVVDHLKKQGKPVYDESILNFKEEKEEAEFDDISDELYDQAVAVVTETRQASISMVQRRLRIGYNRAARMIEKMEAEGVVSAPLGSKGREVLVSNMKE